MPSVIIGADICPIEGNLPYFESGDAESLFHDLLPEFAGADLVVGNLECPFVTAPSPIRKTGPTFGVPGSCINGIRNAGIDILCLANNHILDHGTEGLRHTLAVCAEAGIETVGAGANLDEAGRVLVKDTNGERVALFAVAEHEFSIATDSSAGANPLDIMQFVRTVNRHRADFDHLIVLYHGAAEFQAPTPRVQKTCRFMIEQGASAVIVQHPHFLGGFEVYQGGHIVYGQGALVMDEALYRNRPSFHEGYLVKLTLERNQAPRMDTIPFRQSSPIPGARKLSEQEETRWRSAIAARSAAVADPTFVEAEWREFCSTRQYDALGSLLGYGGIRRRLNASGLMSRRLRRSERWLGIRNMVLCETHREKLEFIFRNSQE